MKTLTIKSEMVESLDSDESKLDFANSLIALLTDLEAVKKTTSESLQDGLNVDLPEPMDGAPEFDSSNMVAPEFKRFSMVQAGFFPVRFDCGYAAYTYKHRDDFSDEDLLELYSDISTKIRRSKGRKDFLVFLNYIQCVFWWYHANVKRKDDNHR